MPPGLRLAYEYKELASAYEQQQAEIERLTRERDECAHFIVEHADTKVQHCRCDACRNVCRSMDEAGYMEDAEERWWEDDDDDLDLELAIINNT